MARVSVEVVGPSNPVPFDAEGWTVISHRPTSEVKFGDRIVYLATSVAVDFSYIPPYLDWEDMMRWVQLEVIDKVEDDGRLVFYVSPELAKEMVSALSSDMGQL